MTSRCVNCRKFVFQPVSCFMTICRTEITVIIQTGTLLKTLCYRPLWRACLSRIWHTMLCWYPFLCPRKRSHDQVSAICLFITHTDAYNISLAPLARKIHIENIEQFHSLITVIFATFSRFPSVFLENSAVGKCLSHPVTRVDEDYINFVINYQSFFI